MFWRMGIAIAALVVAIGSAGISGWSLIYTRKATNATVESTSYVAITTGHDTDRRHAELTPRLRITVEPANPGVKTLKLRIYLASPAELQRLDALTVTIRDDHPWRGEGTPVAAGPTAGQIREQIWGRWRFIPGTGPGADPVRGIPGADLTGRTTPTHGMPVGEELPFFLEETFPPPWSHQQLDSWQEQMGPYLRLRLECVRDGYEPWVLTAELHIKDGVGFAEVPNAGS